MKGCLFMYYIDIIQVSSAYKSYILTFVHVYEYTQKTFAKEEGLQRKNIESQRQTSDYSTALCTRICFEILF